MICRVCEPCSAIQRVQKAVFHSVFTSHTDAYILTSGDFHAKNNDNDNNNIDRHTDQLRGNNGLALNYFWSTYNYCYYYNSCKMKSLIK